MHPPNVLGVEILAVEDVAIRWQSCVSLVGRLSLVGALAFSTDPVLQAQMLGANVALPLVLCVESGVAAGVMEDADVGARVLRACVLVEGRSAREVLLALVTEPLVGRVDLALLVAARRGLVVGRGPLARTGLGMASCDLSTLPWGDPVGKEPLVKAWGLALFFDASGRVHIGQRGAERILSGADVGSINGAAAVRANKRQMVGTERARVVEPNDSHGVE